MKHIFLALFLLPFLAQGQVLIDGVNINESGAKTCQLSMSFVMGKHTTSIDYGQIPDDMSKKEQKKISEQVITSAGKVPRSFQTGMAAVKFMEENGWVFLQYTHVDGQGFFSDKYFFKLE